MVLSHTYASKTNAERAAKAAWEKYSEALLHLALPLQKDVRISFLSYRYKLAGLNLKLMKPIGRWSR